jgi:hypothetical protein
MKYIRTFIWLGAFVIACILQLKCSNNVNTAMEKRDSKLREDSLRAAKDSMARSVESFPDHSEIPEL